MGQVRLAPSGPAAVAPASSKTSWIVGPWQDGLLFLGTPLLILPAVLLILRGSPSRDIALFVAAFGALGHHLPGMMRAYGDRQLFRRFRTRFLVAPIFLVSACVACTLADMRGLVLVTYLWGVWHGLMQTHGLGRIYDAKWKSFARTTAWLDFSMCLAWFGLGMFMSSTRMEHIVGLFYQSGGPLFSPQLVSGMRNSWIAFTALITIAFLVNLILRWREGQRPNPVKIGFFAVSFGFWWYTNVSIPVMILGITLFEIFHDIQYLSIVWIFNRGRVERDATVGSFSRFLFRRSYGLLGLYVGLVFAYGFLGYRRDSVAVWGADSETPWTLGSRLLESFVVASALLHFYFDGFIWKVREAGTRQTLGLEASSEGAAPARKRLSPGVAHGLKWGFLVVPLGTLVALQQDGSKATADDRVVNMSESLPNSPWAQLRLGNLMLRQGRPDEAEAAWERSLEIQPDFAHAHHQLAELQAGRGDLESSLKHAERAVAGFLPRDPERGTALMVLARIHQRMGRLPKATRLAEEALEILPAVGPYTARAHVHLGEMLASSGASPAVLLRHAQDAIDAHPTWDEGHWFLAACLASLLQWDAALAAAQVAHSLAPSTESQARLEDFRLRVTQARGGG